MTIFIEGNNRLSSNYFFHSVIILITDDYYLLKTPIFSPHYLLVVGFFLFPTD
jgi:hypothetical protein